MARPSGPKIRCNGEWTEARYKSFIVSLLRQGTRRWAPISASLKEARKQRGLYLCNSCKELVPFTTKDGRKRVNNVFVDHIKPITDPTVGFVSWDNTIENMFCEKDNLQVLCKDCHDIKTNNERQLAVETRARRKEVQDDYIPPF